ncbi:hypothetical protein [Rhodoferax sp.]|uniref:hypothetical protein n=1 Tax=Rhodoferax sp. TaxID=50421 RepID=UPI001EB70C58|nr:hypothetical protein [Rhodoferax sp.]MBT9507544.1 hypothetical protein [Rhodoferax sp.]
MNHIRSIQQGFAAIAAIFLVVVLAALGGFMLTFSNTQQLTSAQDILGSRSYWAARAGLEWGIAGVTATCPVASTSFAVDAFAVTVTCTLQTYTDAGQPVNIFQLTSVARSSGAAGSVGFVERSLSATLER